MTITNEELKIIVKAVKNHRLVKCPRGELRHIKNCVFSSPILEDYNEQILKKREKK